MERHYITLAVATLLAVLVPDLIILNYTRKHRPEPVVKERTDTVTVTRVDTLVETKYIFSETTRTVTDTVFMETVSHDTVAVPVPIEYRYNTYEDALVLYHGYMAGIDSVIVYPKYETKYITNVTTKVKQPAIVFGPSITAGVDMNGNIRLIPGVSATLNIRSLKKK